MAPKQDAGGGMSKFVLKQDAANSKQKGGRDSRNPSFEDLKEPVPKSGQAAKPRQTRASGLNAVQQRNQGEQVHGGQQTDDMRQFFGTEASSVGDSSETPGADEVQAAHAQAAYGGDNPDEVHAAQLHSDSQYSAGDPQDKDYESGVQNMGYGLPFHGMGPSAIQKMQEMDAAKARNLGGPIFDYMRGDSYPSTTSGPASIREPDEGEVKQFKQEHAPVQAMPPPQREGYRKPAVAHQPTLQNGGTLEFRPSHHQQTQPAKAPLTRPGAANQMPDSHFGTGFRYRPAPNQKASATPHTQQRPPEPAINGLRHEEPLDAAQGNRVSGFELDRRQPVVALVANGHPQSTPREAPVQDQSMVERCAPAKRPHVVQMPHSFAQSRPTPTLEKGDLANEDTQQEQLSPAEEDSVADIDYDVPELHEMEYCALKSQPFDLDPRRELPSFPDLAKDDPIEKQMSTAASFDKAVQHAFLTSLPIDKWEQTGEWFLDKFSETFTKLKEVRREKRKAAHQFEKEIEMRHVAVTKKRKLTEEALGGIRQNGNKVLEGTPKKAKTTT